ncbi:MAG: quercetin dioxygenase-like cupin family protein [Myxococcota bacterium]|jgi:quercetin dioxygenase-like cupin family protein
MTEQLLAELPDGTKMVLLDNTGDTLDVELVNAPNGGGPPAHFHTAMDETYEVIEGSFDVCVEGKWTRLEKGETVLVKAGQSHTFANRSDAWSRVLMIHTNPGQLEAYFRELGALCADGRVRSLNELGSLVHFARTMSAYPDDILVANPVQRLVMRALGGLAPVVGNAPQPAAR